jgi:dTDP-4-dehydrorhamnose 3,5-epimerase
VEIVPFAPRPTAIEGLQVLTMKQATDERGTVRELFRASAFDDAGIAVGGPFRQINVTETDRGGLRGLHAEAMTKLVAVVAGAAFGAYVDLRADSSTRGAVVTVDLVPGVQVLVPSGVANGFQSLVDGTQYLYCFDEEWRPGMPGQSCNPLDPALGITWPVAEPVVSDKDRAAPSLAELGLR